MGTSGARDGNIKLPRQVRPFGITLSVAAVPVIDLLGQLPGIIQLILIQALRRRRRRRRKTIV